MAQFKVVGEEGAEVEFLGEMHKAGEILDVGEEQAEAAAAAVDEGKLEAIAE